MFTDWAIRAPAGIVQSRRQMREPSMYHTSLMADLAQCAWKKSWIGCKIQIQRLKENIQDLCKTGKSPPTRTYTKTCHTFFWGLLEDPSLNHSCLVQLLIVLSEPFQTSIASNLMIIHLFVLTATFRLLAFRSYFPCWSRAFSGYSLFQ